MSFFDGYVGNWIYHSFTYTILILTRAIYKFTTDFALGNVFHLIPHDILPPLILLYLFSSK